MSVLLNPYLVFSGTAREAMSRYAEVLGGELSVTTFADAGAEGVPDPAHVMHAQLSTPDGFTLMGSDMAPGTAFSRGTGMSVSLSGDEAEKMRGWFAALAEGGEVTMPLELQMWGDEYGSCTDRWGVSWMVNIAGSAATS